jgi:putative transposase
MVRLLLLRVCRVVALARDGPARRHRRGPETIATLSTGQEVANLRFFRQEEQALAKAQRAHSKLTKGTPQRATHRKVVARVHERTRWRRSDFSHQHSRRLVHTFDLLAVEDLSVHRMTHHQCLAKSIQDAAWSQFTSLLAYKAAGAGREYGAVHPAYASQDGSRCGHRHVLSLADRTDDCPCGGLVLDRDLNASFNIWRLGHQSRASAEKPPAFAVGSCHYTPVNAQALIDQFLPMLAITQWSARRHRCLSYPPSLRAA